jgi:diacylglycerol kinase family enzyme
LHRAAIRTTLGADPRHAVTTETPASRRAPRVFEPGARIPLLVNGMAGRLRRDWTEPALRTLLAPGIEPQIVYPTSPEDTSRMAREAVAAGAPALLVAGGDGTLNRVAAALAGSEVAMGVLPFGTGNDLAATLGLPLDIAAAAQRLRAARSRRIDLLEVNGATACTVGLLGLVAESAARVIRAGAPGARWRPLIRRLGAASWRLSGTASLLTRPLARPVRVECITPDGDRRVCDRDVAGFFLANGPRLGGGLTLPTSGALDDGVFELCTVAASGRTRLLEAFTDLMLRRPLPPGVLDVQPARAAVISWQVPGPFSADGELLGEGETFHVRVRPAALHVLV